MAKRNPEGGNSLPRTLGGEVQGQELLLSQRRQSQTGPRQPTQTSQTCPLPLPMPCSYPGFPKLGLYVEFVINSFAEIHAPCRCVTLTGPRDMGGETCSTHPRAGSQPKSYIHRLPVHFAPWMIFKAF